MWASMSRKPGQPADDLLRQYKQILSEQSMTAGGERHPEIQVEKRVGGDPQAPPAEGLQVRRRLLRRAQRVQPQGRLLLPRQPPGHRLLRRRGRGPAARRRARACARGCSATGSASPRSSSNAAWRPRTARPGSTTLLNDGLVVLSCDLRGKKPSDRLFRKALEDLQAAGVSPHETLHVGSRMLQDIIPAKRLGMKTALFAGDKASIQATPEQLKESATRPDVLLTELESDQRKWSAHDRLCGESPNAPRVDPRPDRSSTRAGSSPVARSCARPTPSASRWSRSTASS